MFNFVLKPIMEYRKIILALLENPVFLGIFTLSSFYVMYRFSIWCCTFKSYWFKEREDQNLPE